MHIPGSVSPHYAPFFSAARLPVLAPVLALALGFAAASPTPARAQDQTPQSPPAQPSQTPPAPAQPNQSEPAQQTPAAPAQPATQPDAAQQTSAPASATPAATEPQTPASTTPETRSVSVVPPTARSTNSGTATSATTISGPPPSGSDSTLESELRTLLVGKPFFLRGCYLFDDLRFNARGGIYEYSPRGSFTLSGIQIENLRLTKKELILEGDRYGYRFLGALPGNNPTDDMERIKITPKKKVLRIRIEREEVAAQKKEKEKPAKPQPGLPAAAAKPTPNDQAASISAITAAPDTTAAGAAPADPTTTGSAQSRPLKCEETTTSPEHAVLCLKDTLARLFTPSLDDRFIGSMPPFWQLYYKGLASKSGYHPEDPSVLHQSQVDKKARLISAIDPPSNSYAQDYGVAGQALYHVVVGTDGKPGEIAIGQPIGFGLDENAVNTLKKATFEPAVKEGKPVPVVLDVLVQFHIYSKLTSGISKPDAESKPALPGPYSLPPKP